MDPHNLDLHLELAMARGPHGQTSADDPTSEAVERNLARCLTLIASPRPQQPRPGLEERILGRIATQNGEVPAQSARPRQAPHDSSIFVAPQREAASFRPILGRMDPPDPLTAQEPPTAPTRRGWILGSLLRPDTLAVAASLALFVIVLWPVSSYSRLLSDRQLCQANVREIAGGLYLAYEESARWPGNPQALPAAASPGVAWTWDAPPSLAVEAQPNSRLIFELAQNQSITLAMLTCPTDATAEPLSREAFAELVRQGGNFRNPRQVSYSAQLRPMNAGGYWHSQRTPVIVADRNPLCGADRCYQGMYHYEQENSKNHGGTGQNIGRLDGSAQWVNTAYVGPNSDNIYILANGQTAYVGVEMPSDMGDSFLVP